MFTVELQLDNGEWVYPVIGFFKGPNDYEFIDYADYSTDVEEEIRWKLADYFNGIDNV